MPRSRSSSSTGWCTVATISVEQLGADLRDRRERAHPAGVGAGVAVADALEVARGRERQRALAVAQREHRQLVADQQLLDQHRVVAEAPLLDHRHQRGVRLRLVLRDHHALARGQAVGLDHGRVGVDRLQPLGDRAHDPVAAGRHAGRLHHLLREHLRALEPRGLADRPEARHGRGPQRVDEPVHQRRLRARRRRGRRPRRSPRRPARSGSPASASSTSASARIPALPGMHSSSGRCGERGERADQRVLAAARADDEDLGWGESAELRARR